MVHKWSSHSSGDNTIKVANPLKVNRNKAGINVHDEQGVSKLFHHRVPKSGFSTGPRFNLSFRRIADLNNTPLSSHISGSEFWWTPVKAPRSQGHFTTSPMALPVIPKVSTPLLFPSAPLLFPSAPLEEPSPEHIPANPSAPAEESPPSVPLKTPTAPLAELSNSTETVGPSAPFPENTFSPVFLVTPFSLLVILLDQLWLLC